MWGRLLRQSRKFSQFSRWASSESEAKKEWVTITFVDFRGNRRAVDTFVGEPLLAAARVAGTPLQANCYFSDEREFGRGPSCGSCHVYLANINENDLPEMEQSEGTTIWKLINRTGSSRLACRISITKAMNGMVVAFPKPTIEPGAS